MSGGNAQEYIDSLPEKKLIDLATLKSFTRQIAEAVVYLHQRNIVH
jgi:serine/threonine protein kinase